MVHTARALGEPITHTYRLLTETHKIRHEREVSSLSNGGANRMEITLVT